MKIKFASTEEGFFNETISVLNEKKTRRLANHKRLITDSTNVIISHEIKNNVHYLAMRIITFAGDVVAKSEDENYETALIDLVKKADGQLRKLETKLENKKLSDRENLLRELTEDDPE